MLIERRRVPRKTSLALVKERAVTDEEAALMAGRALDEAEALEHPVVPPADIVAELRRQLAETAGVANAAIQQVNQERARADSVARELDHAKADTAKIRETAVQEVSRARQEAEALVVSTQRQAQAAERAAAAAGLVQQAAGALAALFSFLIDRAPVLLTLIGAFVLARDILAAPSAYQLAGLGIYGAVAVMPAVWLSVRRG
jgi:hypothetical protein